MRSDYLCHGPCKVLSAINLLGIYHAIIKFWSDVMIKSKLQHNLNSLDVKRSGCLNNSLAFYYKEIQDLLFKGKDDFRLNFQNDDFNPGYELPQLDDRMLNFLNCSDVSWTEIDDYKDVNITILNMTKNKETQTTKIFASLIMVARVVEYIKRSGNSVTIITPSSANKAMALREAVFRAINFGLVSAEKLNIVSVIPVNSAKKLRASGLNDDVYLNELNPILIFDGEKTVKELVSDFNKRYGADIISSGRKIWYTLSLENYIYADSVRTMIEMDFIKYVPERIQAHAVSSAYGLLGYNYGLKYLENKTQRNLKEKYFLVQHLYNPDMVLDLYYDSFSRENGPEYSQESDGLYYQNDNPYFPYVTSDTQEMLDTTFYSLKPATSKQMKEIIHNNGGGGIVVSEQECLLRHKEIKELLGASNVDIILPESFYDINERSFSMVFTGVLNAIDRGLITKNESVLIHATGMYCKNDYRYLDCETELINVRSIDDMNEIVTKILVHN